MPFDSDAERRRERITRSCGNREALPLDRLWKAEQIGGGKAISRHLWSLKGPGFGASISGQANLAIDGLPCSLSWKPVLTLPIVLCTDLAYLASDRLNAIPIRTYNPSHQGIIIVWALVRSLIAIELFQRQEPQKTRQVRHKIRRDHPVANQLVELVLHLDVGPEADKEEQALLAQRLREDILELDVESAEQVRSGAAPAGAKGEPAALATLAVTLAPVALTELMKALQAWLSRRERASVSVESGGEKILVTGAPSKEQQRLIEAFISRHKQ